MEESLHVAIIGGGLCGLSLAIALKNRSIYFTLYESRSSFTEIGAGRHLGEKVYALTTRNPHPDEETWMYLRYGAKSGDHADGESIDELKAPSTGNLSLHRQELLALLAESVPKESVRFGKKFSGYMQDERGVSISFADGSTERASVVIGCDVIHSKLRIAMFGDENPVSRPSYSHAGCYRAVIPIDKAVATIGENARRSQILFGPRGYLIMYPVSGGKFVNCGAWPGRNLDEWNREEWVKHNQHAQLMEDFKDWGETAKKMLALFLEDVDYWASYQHTLQPDHFQDGRVLLIGDGAHAMPPHEGSGAAQAVEDAYVLAQVFAVLNQGSIQRIRVEIALRAVEEARKPRFTEVHRFSSEGASRWFEFFGLKLEGGALQGWKRTTRERLHYIWDVDMAGEAERARVIMDKHMAELEMIPAESRL